MCLTSSLLVELEWVWMTCPIQYLLEESSTKSSNDKCLGCGYDLQWRSCFYCPCFRCKHSLPSAHMSTHSSSACPLHSTANSTKARGKSSADLSSASVLGVFVLVKVPTQVQKQSLPCFLTMSRLQKNPGWEPAGLSFREWRVEVRRLFKVRFRSLLPGCMFFVFIQNNNKC